MKINNLTSLTSYENIVNSNLNSNKEILFEESLKNAMEEKDEGKLKNACNEFETYFINLLFKEMRNTVKETEGFIKKNQAEVTFTDMLYEEVSKDISKAGGIGIANMMYKQMSKEL